MRKIYIMKLTYISLFIGTFFLPLKTSLSNIGIIFFILLSIYSLIVEGGNFNMVKKISFYLGTTMFLLILFFIGVFISDKENILDVFCKNIFYYITPIVLFRKDLKYEKLLKYGFHGLFYGSILSMLILLINNGYKFCVNQAPINVLLSYDYTGISFVSVLNEMHPIYLGSYFLFMFVGLYLGKIRIHVFLKFFITVLTIVILIFLNSRVIILLFLLISIILLIEKKSLNEILLIATVVSVLFFSILPILKTTYVYNKMVNGTFWELQNNIGKKNINKKENSDSRMSRWIVGISLIEEEVFFGYGIGTEKDLLLREYKRKNMISSVKNRYDLHNQYLSFWFEYGIIGIILFIIFLIINFRYALISKNILWLSFILIIACCALVENYMKRNMGINFIIIYSVVFSYSNKFKIKKS